MLSALCTCRHWCFILLFRFELGSGPAVLLSSLPVNDGQWHTVEVFRWETLRTHLSWQIRSRNPDVEVVVNSLLFSLSLPIIRSYKEGSLKVDDEEPVNGTSAEGSSGLNIQGSIFIGDQRKVLFTSFSLTCNAIYLYFFVSLRKLVQWKRKLNCLNNAELKMFVVIVAKNKSILNGI